MSKTPFMMTPLALLAAFTLFSTPAVAQQRDGRRNRSGQESGGQAEGRERAQPRAQAQAPQAQAPQAQAPQAQAPQQAQQQRRAVAPRVESGGATGQYAVPRRAPVQPLYNNNGANGRYYGPQHSAPRYYAPRYYAPHYYAPRYYAPRYGPSVYGYYRPYLFRPHLSIGFGVFMGYPVPYSYSYPYPITVYGYRAPRAPIVVGPGSPYYGGVALEITPYDADVYVDGNYAGRVENFDGSSQPLTLTAGTHRIEVQSNGYAPLVFDVGVQAGQIIPYRGDLQPY